jgi:hypothetical protein
VSALAYEPGYEDYCDRLEPFGTSDGDDEAAHESDWASRLGRCDDNERGDQDMDTGFENELTVVRDETGVFPAEAIGAELESDAGAKVLLLDPREQDRLGEAVDAISFLHPNTVVKLVGDLLGGMPVETRATVIAESFRELDYTHIGELSREGLLMLREAKRVHAERLKALKAASFEAECAYHYAIQGLGVEAGE